MSNKEDKPQDDLRVMFENDPFRVYVGRWVSWSTSRKEFREWAERKAEELSLPAKPINSKVYEAAILAVDKIGPDGRSYSIRDAVRKIFPGDPVKKWEDKVSNCVQSLKHLKRERKRNA